MFFINIYQIGLGGMTVYRATVEMCLPGEIWLYSFNRGILYYIFVLHVSIKCLVVVFYISHHINSIFAIFRIVVYLLFACLLLFDLMFSFDLEAHLRWSDGISDVECILSKRTTFMPMLINYIFDEPFCR